MNEFEGNISKSFIMLFRRNLKYDFQPELCMEPSEDMLNVVSKAKILELYLTDSLRWDKRIEWIGSKASTRIWALRRLMELGLDNELYLNAISRSVVFHGSLTRKQDRIGTEGNL